MIALGLDSICLTTHALQRPQVHVLDFRQIGHLVGNNLEIRHICVFLPFLPLGLNDLVEDPSLVFQCDIIINQLFLTKCPNTLQFLPNQKKLVFVFSL